MKKTTSALMITLLTTIGPASAAVTFVDAIPTTNTVLSAGGVDFGTDNNSDGKWYYRTSGSLSFFQAVTENAPELKTTISGLADGSYNVYGFYFDSPGSAAGQNWDAQFGLTSGSVTLSQGDTAPNASALTFEAGSAPTSYTEGTNILRYAVVGVATVSGGAGIIEVFVDDRQDATDNRTWYEGVGYEAVPEPSSTALLGLGGLALLLRRRK